MRNDVGGRLRGEWQRNGMGDDEHDDDEEKATTLERQKIVVSPPPTLGETHVGGASVIDGFRVI